MCFCKKLRSIWKTTMAQNTVTDQRSKEKELEKEIKLLRKVLKKEDSWISQLSKWFENKKGPLKVGPHSIYKKPIDILNNPKVENELKNYLKD